MTMPPDEESRDDLDRHADAAHLDGNAVAGLLGELFAFDVTTSLAACAACGAANQVGAVVAYLHGMGAVLRCPACGAALIRIGRGSRRTWIDLRGVSVLRIQVPEAR
jgi:hypothetical protein